MNPDRPKPLAALASARRQRRTLTETAHRPWPLPDGPWIMGQSWLHLLFAHWPVAPEALEHVVPPQLPLDLYEGRAWIGITPFRVEGLRLRGAPPPPYLSRFAELNVRTYVELGGKPGIYFLSLDAAHRSAVLAARRGYRLPYFHARMSLSEEAEGFRMRHERISDDGPHVEFECLYQPTGERFRAAPGSLDAWFTERYCLYTLAGEEVRRADIHHPPWPLQPASARIARNTMAEPFGVELERDPLLHYSGRQDVVLWAIGSPRASRGIQVSAHSS